MTNFWSLFLSKLLDFDESIKVFLFKYIMLFEGMIMIEKKERKSNIDLLKIILAFMVIVIHFNHKGMGGGTLYTTKNNLFFLNFMTSLSVVAVNCFVLITGYFSINNNSFKTKKFFICI